MWVKPHMTGQKTFREADCYQCNGPVTGGFTPGATQPFHPHCQWKPNLTPPGAFLARGGAWWPLLPCPAASLSMEQGPHPHLGRNWLGSNQLLIIQFSFYRSEK